MSTPILTKSEPLPVIFDAPLQPPQGFGLYSVAALINTGSTPRELIAGIDLYPRDCDDGYGSFTPALCPDDDVDKAPGSRGELSHFDPLVVWSATECRPDQSEAEQLARARQIQALHEPIIVESAFGTRILTDAGAADAAATFLEAIGNLEAWQGEQGYAGVIHASRKWAATAAYYGLLSNGPILRTPMGNVWNFGGGLDSVLGDTLVITGPVTVWRSDQFEQVKTVGSHPTPEFNNTIYSLVERAITVGYECLPHAVTIS